MLGVDKERHKGFGTMKDLLKKFFPRKDKKPFSLTDEVKDWIISFVIAAVVYFVLLPAVLGSSSPMVVVSSCSEKGYINIGDILIIQGVNIKDIVAPTINVSSFDNFTYEFNQNQEITRIFVDGTPIALDRNSDIIVYSADPSRAQIIHRVFAKIYDQTAQKYYIITKGDANQIPDQISRTGGTCVKQNTGCITDAITQENLVGKRVFVNVPFLGHVKLFFCDITRLCDGHANLGTNYEFKLSC